MVGYFAALAAAARAMHMYFVSAMEARDDRITGTFVPRIREPTGIRQVWVMACVVQLALHRSGKTSRSTSPAQGLWKPLTSAAYRLTATS